MQLLKIGQIKPNPNNPRVIKDDKFEKLVNSIKEFPQMLEKRPIVVNGDMIVLGGNMRLRACKAAGLKEVPVLIADDWTEEQQRQFIVKDNVSFGAFDWDSLANEWDADQLNDWGLDIPGLDVTDTDYSGKNQEVDVNEFGDMMTIKLNYSEDEYNQVREGLSKIAATPEQAVWKLLGNE